ncbi:AraC family transcriptional regulator [Gordonia sp. NPDC003424]
MSTKTSETIRARLPLLEATDLEDARAHIENVYIPHQLVTHDGPQLGFKMAHFETSRITFGHVTYGADSELVCPAMESCYHVNLTLTGNTQIRQGGRAAITSGRSSGGAFNPDDAYQVRWSPDAIQYCLKLPDRSLNEQLTAILGQPCGRLRFDLTFDLLGEQGRSLLAAVTHPRNQYASIDAAGSVAARTALSQLESYVLTQMLLTTRHNFSDVLHAEQPGSGRNYVRQAAQLLEGRAAEPWTVVDLAREVHIGARALQVGFRKELGVSPMEYLREVRLRRVRDDLLSNTDEHVSDIATRWGFYHLGRFSQLYRERFGTLPSQTMQLTGHRRK